jgi:hypothetical protein
MRNLISLTVSVLHISLATELPFACGAAIVLGVLSWPLPGHCQATACAWRAYIGIGTAQLAAVSTRVLEWHLACEGACM